MRRIAVWKLMLAVVFIAFIMNYFLMPAGKLIEYARLQRGMDSSIRNLRPSGPPPAGWDCAHSWAITAYGNVCFSPDHASFAEMYRLRDDLNEKLKGNIDMGTLVWIWDRLGKTGPHGKDYTDKFRQSFLDCFPTTAKILAKQRLLLTRPQPHQPAD